MIDATTVLAISMFVLAGLVLIAVAVPDDARPRTFTLFGVHLALSFGLYAAIGLWSPDAILYDQQARQLMAHWAGETASAPRVTVGKEGWPTLLALLYQYTAPSPLVGLVVNAIFSALCLPLVRAAARLVGASDEAALRSTWWLFLPPFLGWGSLLLREAGVWFFLLVVAVGGLRVADRRSGPSGAVLLAVGTVGLASFRASAALVTILAVVVALVLTSRAALPARLVVVAAAAAASPFVLTFLSTSSLTDAESLARSQSSLSESDSGFASNSLANLPLGVARAMLGPFPWEWPGLSPIYVVAWASWMAVVVVMVKTLRRGRNLAILLAPASGLLLALAYTSGNYGTMIRLRDSALLLLVPLTALVLVRGPREASPPRRRGASPPDRKAPVSV